MKFPLPFCLPGAAELPAAHQKQRAEAAGFRGLQMWPPGIPPDVVCLKGPEVASTHVWEEEKEAPAETPVFVVTSKVLGLC